MAASFTDLFVATTPITLNEKKVNDLVDTGSTERFIWELLVQKLHLPTLPKNNTMSMVSTSLIAQSAGAVEYTDCFSAEG